MGKASDKYDDHGRLKVRCHLCKRWYHRLDAHLRPTHGWTVEQYQKRYPRSKTISDAAKERCESESVKVVEREELSSIAMERALRASERGELYRIVLAYDQISTLPTGTPVYGRPMLIVCTRTDDGRYWTDPIEQVDSKSATLLLTALGFRKDETIHAKGTKRPQHTDLWKKR